MDEIEMAKKEESTETSKKKKSFSESFKAWATADLKMTLLFCLIGIFMGVIAFFLYSSLRSLLISILLFIGCALTTKRVFKIKETKGWWFSKFVVFFFTWIIAWTLLYNLYNVWV